MKIHRLGLVCLCLLGLVAANAQDQTKVDALANAIAHAEGYGRKHAIPTRYNNPGDLKARTGVRLPGQTRIGKGGHIVFRTAAAGWNALRDQITKMVDGRSRQFNQDMTLAQIARRYATRWQPWAVLVSRQLGVSPQTTLRQYFTPAEVRIPETPLTTPKVIWNFAPRCLVANDLGGGGF